MTAHTQVLPPMSIANKSRALTVIQNAAVKRREVLLARIKPLADELKQLDAILATGNTDPAATEAPAESEAE